MKRCAGGVSRGIQQLRETFSVRVDPSDSVALVSCRSDCCRVDFNIEDLDVRMQDPSHGHGHVEGIRLIEIARDWDEQLVIAIFALRSYPILVPPGAEQIAPPAAGANGTANRERPRWSSATVPVSQ